MCVCVCVLRHVYVCVCVWARLCVFMRESLCLGVQNGNKTAGTGAVFRILKTNTTEKLEFASDVYLFS